MSEEVTRLDQALDEITELSASNILEIKRFLSEEWKPRTADEAIKAINFIHVITSSAKHMREACASVLDRCKHCDGERVDAVTGLKVLRAEKPARKVYEPSDKLLKLEDEMKKLKEKIKKEKEKCLVGEETQDGFNYKVKF